MKIVIELYDHRYELWNYPEWCLGETRALAYDHEVIMVASEEQIAEHLSDMEVYFGWHLPEEKFVLAKNLKWLHSSSDDIRRQLYPAFVESDVVLTMSRGTRASAIAEHALGMMLYFARQFHICVRSQMRAAWARGTAWDHFPNFQELDGSVLGIIGLGRIGRELARRCKMLGMEVIATTKKWPSVKPDYVDHIGPPDELPLLLEESDFLVCCIPETGDTDIIMGYEQFKRMKKTAYFFNVGRGTAVNEDELVEALMDHLIAGAGLDTFQREPLPEDSYLWRLEGTLITPRIAGIGPHFWRRTHNTWLNLLRRYLAKEPFDEVVEKKVMVEIEIGGEGSEDKDAEALKKPGGSIVEKGN
ncbi:MAG TPA: D-2-hydroxyacid dehydrogenase [Firmicutes bacterium]|nr:D-2-hydroxyacid dehydrogenase [Bacillota bacterium]